MPELFIELFSEEIPARMQAGGAAELERSIGTALAALHPNRIETFHGPRRIALSAEVEPEVAAASATERGPRLSAPEQAIAGFLRKHGAEREQLRREGEYWVLEKRAEAVGARQLIAASLPALLRRFSWPKSMRWGRSAFTWVRPLRRIVCLLDGDIVPFDLRDGADDGHGLISGNLTEGHRFHAPGTFAVTGCADWRRKLAAHRVLVQAEERRLRIARGLAAEAEARGLVVVDDPGLLEEVAGLVEWPVPLLGRIDPAFMDLPPEVLQVSMRVNQRYFALRAENGSAPWFGFVANIEAEDGGAAIIAGNERVLRARFADARHFWNQDRRIPLADRVPALDAITFHAKLGSQGERVRRLAVDFAARDRAACWRRPGARRTCGDARQGRSRLRYGGRVPRIAGRDGPLLCAARRRSRRAVADAIRDHYAPRGAADAVPSAPVSVAVALADKLDQLAVLLRHRREAVRLGRSLRAAARCARCYPDNEKRSSAQLWISRRSQLPCRRRQADRLEQMRQAANEERTPAGAVGDSLEGSANASRIPDRTATDTYPRIGALRDGADATSIRRRAA